VRPNLQRRLGARIRELRSKRKWSQEQLAEACRLHWTYVGQVERGERNLTLQSIEALAKGLDMRISDLFKAID
jgi:XRE family transcriptional regulator, regulator of sulfur utilization